MRLQNFPAIEYATVGEWASFFRRACASVRIESPGSDEKVAWRVNMAALDDIAIAFGLHGSPLALAHSGAEQGLQLFLPYTGRADLTIRGDIFQATPGQALLVDLSEPGRLSVPAASSAIVLKLPETAVQAQFASRGKEHLPMRGFEPVIPLSSGIGAALLKVIEALVGGLESGLFQAAPVAAGSLTQALLSLVAEIALSGRQGQALAAERSAIAPRYVRRAIEVMRTRLNEPLTIADIAAASQTSVRSLQRTFKEAKGESPLAYLKRLRLQAAHAELTDPAGKLTVAEIAMKWGFTHVGRFSSDYRAAFGRLPSADLKLARQG